MTSWLDQDPDDVGGERADEIFPVYELAWELLRDGGSSESFSDELRAAGLEGDILTSGTLEHEFWFGAWKAGVKPSRLASWGLVFAASSIGKYARDGLEGLDEDPDWMKVPGEVRETGRKWGVEITSSRQRTVRVRVEMDPSSPDLVERCLTLEPNKSGLRILRVWIDTRVEARLPVMVGSERLGWAVDDESKSPLPPATSGWRRRARVPSGTIKVATDSTGTALTAHKPAKIVVPQ